MTLRTRLPDSMERHRRALSSAKGKTPPLLPDHSVMPQYAEQRYKKHGDGKSHARLERY